MHGYNLIKWGSWLLLLLSLGVGLARAQQPVVVALGEKDGLNDLAIYDLHEDERGFFWLAADKGLFRYDGQRSTYFSNSEKKGLSVFYLQADSLDRLWCINISGQLFYHRADSLYHFADFGDQLPSKLADFVVRKSHIYVFADNQVFSVSLATRTTEVLYESPYRIGRPFVTEEKVWFNCGPDLIEISEEGRVASTWDEALLASVYTELGSSFLFRNTEGFFCVKRLAHNELFYRPDRAPTGFTQVALPPILSQQRIVDVRVLDDQLWFCTAGGLRVYDFIEGRLRARATYLAERFVTDFLIDKDQNYWISTLKRGIYVIPNMAIRQPADQPQTGLISALVPLDTARVLYGTDRGEVFEYDFERGRVRQRREADDFPIISLAKMPAGWISVNLPNGSLRLTEEALRPEEPLLLFHGAKAILPLSEAELLVLNYSSARIVRFDAEGDLLETRFLRHHRAHRAHYDTVNQGIYVSYNDRLIYYDREGRAQEVRWRGKDLFATSFGQTRDGSVWGSTFTDGILRLEEGRVAANLRASDGLLSDQVTYLKADGEHLWLVTDEGLQYFHPGRSGGPVLTVAEGIPTYRIAGIEVLGERVVFAGEKGLFVVDKETVFKKSKAPQLYLRRVRIADRDTSIHDRYELAPNQNKVRFDFFANGFRSADNIYYQCRLWGKTAGSWTNLEPGIDHVTYNSLSSGRHRFEVRAVNRSNQQVSSTRSVLLWVRAPFWQRWWFIVLVILSATLILYRYTRQREERQRLVLHQVEQDKKMVTLQLENLRSQMNPHFIFNALNSIQEYIILNEKYLASDYLGKFADLIRAYLRHSSLGVISLREEVDCLRMYLDLEQMRFEDLLHYDIVLPLSEEEAEQLFVPTMLIQPYVENALKHGLLHKKSDRRLRVVFVVDAAAAELHCTITDNGIGRRRAQAYQLSEKKYQSFATRATSDRLSLLNRGQSERIGVHIEDLYDAEGRARGTRVHLRIPWQLNE
ncbi:MAG: histidine kinase [Bacteroidota bacterium]